MPYLTYNKETKKWDEVPAEEVTYMDDKKHIPIQLHLSSLLRNKLDFAKRNQAMNNDVVGIVDGGEGSGKSSLAGNIMRYLTNDEFDPLTQMIGSDYEDAITKIQEAKPGTALMFDEGNVFFLATETMKREHRDLHKVFSIFRQKNLFVIIVLPSFIRLGSYFALDRSKFLIRTYLDKKTAQRGKFAYYGEKQKEFLYTLSKKNHYKKNLVAPKFRRKFKACYPLENKEYKAFKLKTLNASLNISKENIKKNKPATYRDHKTKFMKKIVSENDSKTSEELGTLLGVVPSRIRNIRKEIRDEENNNDK